MTAVFNPTNKKFALLIGINYFNTPSQLYGCINDAKNIKAFLKTQNYLEEHILMLIDDGTTLMPTKQNIINALNTLINKANNEQFNEFTISCSGHGSFQ